MRERAGYSLEQQREILEGYIFRAIEIVEGRNHKDKERTPLEIGKLTEFVKNAQDVIKKPDQLADPLIVDDLITQALLLDISERLA
jgi:hypothetical protein